MNDVRVIRELPFGIYSFTKPLDKKPDDGLYSFDVEHSVYFGVAGSSYSYLDFYHDPKRDNRNWSCGKVYSRLNSHRKHILRSNEDTKREKSFEIFYENFGHGSHLLDLVYFSVFWPKDQIEDFKVRAWALAMESNAIYAYTSKFDKLPIMQVAHNPKLIDNRVETSISSQHKKYLETVNLERFLDLPK